MARSHAERELTASFDADYLAAQNDLKLELERVVCGCDYGGTSWTTKTEAEHLGRLLGLGPGRRLLELGAGSGWPALFLAGTVPGQLCSQPGLSPENPAGKIAGRFRPAVPQPALDRAPQFVLPSFARLVDASDDSVVFRPPADDYGPGPGHDRHQRREVRHWPRPLV